MREENHGEDHEANRRGTARAQLPEPCWNALLGVLVILGLGMVILIALALGVALGVLRW
ncbi:MAG: hypothetical protein HY783_09935 [Chloroflexi bacterium]|nr:hypothetical protein [Chloroflexota bacterium]